MSTPLRDLRNRLLDTLARIATTNPPMTPLEEYRAVIDGLAPENTKRWGGLDLATARGVTPDHLASAYPFYWGAGNAERERRRRMAAT